MAIDEWQIRGVIFTSGLAREIFTAGNDIAELYAPKTSLELYTEFWTVATTFLARLLRSPLVTVSVVQGVHGSSAFIVGLMLQPPIHYASADCRRKRFSLHPLSFLWMLLENPAHGARLLLPVSRHLGRAFLTAACFATWTSQGGASCRWRRSAAPALPAAAACRCAATSAS